ncbi:hypothetical protein TWF173_000529 [Orbilia oligospora]|nr:hypothetical protein TWF173_000529 [Orbilia oligospora]
MLQEGLAPKVKTNIGFVLAAEFAKEWDRRSPKTVPNNGPRPSVSVSMAARLGIKDREIIQATENQQVWKTYCGTLWEW